MKALTLIFVILIALLQYPLWLGKGSWLRVWDLNRQVAAQQEKNSTTKARNDMLEAEVRDLKSGHAAIEERARSELGMIKQDEVFYQVVDQPLLPPAPVIPAPVIRAPAKVPQLDLKTQPDLKPKTSAKTEEKSGLIN